MTDNINVKTKTLHRNDLATRAQLNTQVLWKGQ